VLIQAFNHKDSNVRWCVVETLGKISSEQIVLALTQELNHKDPSVRCIAEKVLRKDSESQFLVQLWQLYQLDRKQALDRISGIQDYRRFYNYEIEKIKLSTDSEADCDSYVTNINISGGNFGDVVARAKTIQVERDYVENQENQGNSTSD